MAEDRLVLLYQPIVQRARRRVERVEALLRWRKPRTEQETLTDLIWAAERSPVIFKLENWILDQSFRAAAGWRKAGLAGVRVNVNLSAREFPRADLVAARHAAARRPPASTPPTVGLEITETSSMRRFDEVAEQIDRLIGHGHRAVARRLRHRPLVPGWLSHLPLHGVKIPGTFVERLRRDALPAIVARVIDLAHDLGLRVIAEGVETAEQRDFLAERGCDLFQGFLFYAAHARGRAAGRAGRRAPRPIPFPSEHVVTQRPPSRSRA